MVLECNIKEYAFPSDSVVLSSGWSIDLIIHKILLTFLNPILIFIYMLFQYLREGAAIFSAVTGILCTFIEVAWIFRAINIQLRSCSSECRFSQPNKLIILITGGSNGLGLQLAKTFGSDSNVKSLIIMDLAESKELKDLKRIYGNKIIFKKCDLSIPYRARDVTRDILSKYGRVDSLICNAGVRQYKDFIDLKLEELHTLVQVNFISHCEMINEVVKNHKIENPEDRLHIVAVSSVLGFVSPMSLGIYSATKASLTNFMDALRYEVPNQIVLSTICPGQLTTDMFSDIDVGKGFLAPLVDHRKLARRIVEIIRNGRNGLFAYPFYARFMPAFRCMPWYIYQALRKFSAMDRS
mgnify:FL=1